MIKQYINNGKGKELPTKKILGHATDDDIDIQFEFEVPFTAMDFFEKFPNAPRSSDGIPQTCWGHVYGDGRYCPSDACTECWNREMKEDG